MTGQSLDVVLAVLQEQMRTVLNGQLEAREGHKEQYEQAEQTRLAIALLSSKVAIIEESLAKSAPTIEEFITIKHKVVGAGIAGKWVWGIGGIILTVVLFLRETIIQWLGKTS